MTMQDQRFDVVLADIQEFARLPSKESAIEFFWKRNQGDVDIETLHASFFSPAQTASEALNIELLKTAEAFLASGDTLRRKMTFTGYLY